MTATQHHPDRASQRHLPRVLLADRGDALVASMSVAMRHRFDVVDQLDTDLTRAERLLVAGATFRPRRQLWADRFFKSGVGVALRSRHARAGLADTADAADVVFQTHALFETSDARTVLYIDCTHRQSMEQWPDWNPLHGRALRRWLEREVRQYQQAAHIFAFYDETARSLVEQYDVPPERVSVVGAGVSFSTLPPLGDRAARHGLVGRPPTVLFVGNDFNRKGGPRLLDAFDRLRQRIPDARLRIAGTASDAPAHEGVEHLGRVHGRDQMSRLYAEADVFCLPSLYDPYPGALLEAMAHGLPSVVTDVCGIPEIVEDTALQVSADPTATAELADALERLLVDTEEAARLGLAARRRVEEHLVWPRVLDRMAPVFEGLADRSAIGPDPDPPPGGSTRTSTRTATRTATTTAGGPTMTQTARATPPRPVVSDRPWGRFAQLSLNETSTVKIITVQPGQRLSLQRHEHRGELWEVLDAAMDVEVDGRQWTARHGEQVWVPQGASHRMSNPGDQPARVLEVAFGFFDEQDIERIADDYAR